MVVHGATMLHTEGSFLCLCLHKLQLLKLLKLRTRSKIRAGCANLQRVAARMVGSTWFNLVFAVVIITNSLPLDLHLYRTG